MGSMTPQTASSSFQNRRRIEKFSIPSFRPPLPLGKYEVFLSFYGDDTCKEFTDNLYSALKQKGILACKGDGIVPRRRHVAAWFDTRAIISPRKQKKKEIQESIYAIVIISPRYAFSKFCLIDLAEIIECMRYKGLIVIPIFYHVDPSDLRNHRGTFAEAFDKHDKDPRVDTQQKQTWRDALTTVANLSRWLLGDYGHEATVVEEITRGIIGELSRRFSINSGELVGIEARVEEMMKLLGIWSDEQDVRFLGLHGMGGVGKTTLAQIIYDGVSYHFEVCNFIASISEGAKEHGLAALQNELISEDMSISNVHVGTNVIVDRLCNRQVLVVLDDVDSKEQLEALAGSHDWFGPRSRIIFTSRDRGLLEEQYGAKIVLYEVKVLNEVQALQLFSLSAFKTAHPKENYEELSELFTNYAQGLPLALKVLGSFLFGRTIYQWKSAWDLLQVNPMKKITDVLELGFSGLDDLQKKLFLDIAFFFEGELLDDLLEVLESFSYYPKVNINVLVNKSLITISEGRLRMHSLLQKMAQNIVSRESPKEPCQHSRLWHYDDVRHVLEYDTENDVIEGIALSLPIPGYVRSNAKAFSKMKRLRILKMDSTIIV